MRATGLPDADDLAAAREHVAARLAPTPLVAGDRLGARLKLETFQPTGSFKVRGALAALARLDPDAPVVAASAGNHGLGVAWAAAALGRAATVVVPETASAAKVAALRRSGARLIQHGATYDDAEAHALDLARAGAAFVSPYNDRHVIAGQATIGWEIGAALGDDVCVACPVGGGGLLAGLLAWAGARGSPRVIGVSAAASPVVAESVRVGRLTEVDVRPTLADGLAGNLEPGTVTVEAAAAAAALPLVSEAEIERAIRFLAAEHGLVAEGAGATAVAAVLSGAIAARPGETLVVVVTGRNIALPALARVLAGETPREAVRPSA